MEITLESIISLVGLFVGGGGGAFFTWKWMRRKARAEAVTAEVDAAKDMQELYKKMIDHSNEYLEDADRKMDAMRQERDHYKADRDELREKVDKLTKMFYELKTEGEKERAQLRVSISTLQSQLRGIIGLTCSVADCKLRQVISFTSEDDQNRKRRRPRDNKDIEPVEQQDM